MTASALILDAQAEACQPWPRHVLAPQEWRAMAEALAAEPTLALLAQWADTQRVHALFHDEATGRFIPASVPVEAGHYWSLAPHRPAAAWFERMIHDLWGHKAAGAADGRPWLDHGAWSQVAPMSARPAPRGGLPEPPAFLPAEGPDLHVVPLGPVHGLVTESAHIRFAALGETVVRTEVRLGYLHKGTMTLMRGQSPRAAARFAARLSGDSTVAHSIAFAHAAEAASGAVAPPRALALRAVMAEQERIASHLAAAAAIGIAAGIPLLAAAASRLRETMLAAAQAAFGHRLMMDCVIPGGVVADIAAAGATAILAAMAGLDAALPGLQAAHAGNAAARDKLAGVGVVPAALATRLAAGGPVGRASGRIGDARRHPGYPPYDSLAFDVPLADTGDAAARLALRLAELRESAHLLRSLLADLPAGPVAVSLPVVSGEAFGCAEGFRGEIWHWLRLDGGMIANVFLRDPSWLQWPLLEAAMHDTRLSEFETVRESFNCSVSGVDL